MSRPSSSSIALFIGSALTSVSATAAEEVTLLRNQLAQIEQCRINEPDATASNSQPINVEADKLEVVRGKHANYSGMVIVVQGKKSSRPTAFRLIRPKIRLLPKVMFSSPMARSKPYQKKPQTI